MNATREMPDGWLAVKIGQSYRLWKFKGHSESGTPMWQEFAGPYKRRINAVRRAESEVKKTTRVTAVRKWLDGNEEEAIREKLAREGSK